MQNGKEGVQSAAGLDLRARLNCSDAMRGELNPECQLPLCQVVFAVGTQH